MTSKDKKDLIDFYSKELKKLQKDYLSSNKKLEKIAFAIDKKQKSNKFITFGVIFTMLATAAGFGAIMTSSLASIVALPVIFGFASVVAVLIETHTIFKNKTLIDALGSTKTEILEHLEGLDYDSNKIYSRIRTLSSGQTTQAATSSQTQQTMQTTKNSDLGRDL